ncbi:MAG: hypothetical protein MK180_01615 [Rhodobacteraceae bacterium]|nr:hypothetical protein [Paracoccaceae bacterium]
MKFSEDLSRLEIHRSRSKTARAICGSIAFVFVGIWFASGALVEARGYLTVYIGWVAIAFGATLAVFYAARLFAGDPVVVVLSPSGFSDNRAFSGVIAWQSVGALGHLGQNPPVNIRVPLLPGTDPKPPSNWAGRVWSGITANRSSRAVTIMTAELDISAAELAYLLKRYAREFGVHEDQV